MTDNHAQDGGALPRENLIRATFPAKLELRDNTDTGMPVMNVQFARYNEWTEIDSLFEGHFMERIAPKAFAKTIKENTQNMRVLFNHGRDPHIGDKVLGKIESLKDTETGPRAQVPLFDTSYNRDLIPALKAGEYGSSFRFSVVREEFVRNPERSDHNPQGLPERTITEAKVPEFGPVTFPQYLGASAGVRSLTDDLLLGRFEEAGRRRTSMAIPERTQEQLYARSVGYVGDSVWAMHPSALATVLSIIAERKSGHKPTDEEIRERIGTRATEAPKDTGSVAVIPIDGAIVPKANLFGDVSGATSMEAFQESFREALANGDVTSILLNIDSPGGSVDLVPEVATEILAARGKKPIVAVANTFAASAAYWLASAADEIVVTPSGEVGSIGVYSAHDDLSAAQEKLGVKTTLVSAGKYKVEGNPYEPLSDEAHSEMQRKTDAYYKMFVEAVAKGRGVSAEEVRASFGEGRMVMAGDAVTKGMADRVATIDATLARLKKSAAAVAKPKSEPTPKKVETVTTEEVSTINAEEKAAPPHPPSEVRRDTQPDKTVKAQQEEKKMPNEYKSVEEVDVRLAEIEHEQNEIYAEWGVRAFDADTQNRWDEMKDEKEELKRDKAAFLERKAYIDGQIKKDAIDRGAGSAYVVANRNSAPDNVFDLAAYHDRATSQEHLSRLYKEGAERALDGMKYPNPNVDQAKASENVKEMLDKEDPMNEMSQRLLIHGSPTYRSAFWKTQAKQPLNAEEQRKMAEGMQLERAGLTAAGDGGITVPVQIDPTILLSSSGALNPFRQISRIVRTTSYQWQGVTSAGVTAAYALEGAVMLDNTPTLVAPTITPERANVFVPYTWEAAQDWASLEGEMAALFADSKDILEATKFAVGAGHGSNEPQGVLVGAGTLVGGATITVGTTDLFRWSDALPVRFQPRASWLATPTLYSKIRQVSGGANTGIWAENLQVGNPPQLLGYPAYKASSVGTAWADLGGGPKAAIIGDFNLFAIVDRIGFQVRQVDTLFTGSTAGGINYPNGMSGLIGYWRGSSGVLASNAFRTGTVS